MFLSNVRLDSKSLNKLINGSKVIVKNHETGYDVSLVFYEKKAYNKLQKALSSGKGSSIDGDKDIEEILLSDVVDGEGILRKLKKGFNKIGKHLEKNAGNYVETAKKIVPKSAVKGLTNAAIIAGTTYIGQPELAEPLMKASNLGVNTLYNKDFKKPLKSGWEQALQKGVMQSANEELNAAKNSFKSVDPPIQTAIPIEEGKGMQKLKNMARRTETTGPKPKALPKKKPVGAGFKPIGKGFKPVSGSGFFPIG